MLDLTNSLCTCLKSIGLLHCPLCLSTIKCKNVQLTQMVDVVKEMFDYAFRSIVLRTGSAFFLLRQVHTMQFFSLKEFLSVSSLKTYFFKTFFTKLNWIFVLFWCLRNNSVLLITRPYKLSIEFDFILNVFCFLDIGL